MSACKQDLQKLKKMNESEYFQTSRPGLEQMMNQMNGWNIWAAPVYTRDPCSHLGGGDSVF